MSDQDNAYRGPIAAWVDPREFVPTLHVGGTIYTNGEKPIVSLKEAEPQGTNIAILLLNMHPDVYDPKGEQKLLITEFQKPLVDTNAFTSVTILGEKGSIDLPVQKKLPEELEGKDSAAKR